MATAPSQIQPVPIRPSIVTAPPSRKEFGTKWLKWGAALGLALALIVGGLLWRAHLQNTITYETVPVVRRPSIQARIAASGNLNAVVDVLIRQPGFREHQGPIRGLEQQSHGRGALRPNRPGDLSGTSGSGQRDVSLCSFGIDHSASTDRESQVRLSSAIASEKDAEAILVKDQANATNATAQYSRVRALVAEGIMSPQDLDTAKAGTDSLQAQTAADQAQIDAAKPKHTVGASVRSSNAERAGYCTGAGARDTSGAPTSTDQS